MDLRGRALALGPACLLAAGCAPAAPRYRPQTRHVTVTTVPLLVKEQMATFPFLARDFAPKGVLAGREVYAFEPNSITAGVGDTLDLTFINPEDDVHSFVLGDLVVPLPPQQQVSARWIAPHPGIFPFTCAVPAHLPMMAGQVVVLSAATLTP